MREDIDTDKIESGDKVRFSLHGAPVEGWFTVTKRPPVRSLVMVEMPDGERGVPVQDITAHEPKDPRPDWLDAHVILDADGTYGLPFGGHVEYRGGAMMWQDVAAAGPVTVIVDAEGNQPAGARYGAAYGIQAMRERDNAIKARDEMYAAIVRIRDRISAERDSAIDRGAHEYRLGLDFAFVVVGYERDAL